MNNTNNYIAGGKKTNRFFRWSMLGLSLLMCSGLFFGCGGNKQSNAQSSSQPPDDLLIDRTPAPKPESMAELETFLQTLAFDDEKSATQAREKAESLMGDNKEDNDRLAVALAEYLNTIAYHLNRKYEGKNLSEDAQSSAVLVEAGFFLTPGSESTEQIHADPIAVYTELGDKLSDAMAAYLKLESDDLTRGELVDENNALTIAWDSVGERIYARERFLKDNPDFALWDDIFETMHSDATVYAYAISYSGGDKLPEELQNSYQNFTKDHDDSCYAAGISSIYNAYKEKGFSRLDDGAIMVIMANTHYGAL